MNEMIDQKFVEQEASPQTEATTEAPIIVSTPVENKQAEERPRQKYSRRRGPGAFWSLLGFIMRDYLRSAWPLVNVAILVGAHSLFFNYRSGQGHFFAVEYALVIMVAALTTAILFSRANRPEIYAILARPVRRATLAVCVMLVAWTVAITFHLVSTAIESLRFGEWLNQGLEPMEWRNPLTYLTGTLPMVVAAAAAVALVALLSTFVASPEARLGVLAILALLVMSFDSKNFPIESMRPLLQQLPPVLAPAAGALKYATEPRPDSIASTSLALLAIYALVLTAAALWMASNRELVLD